MESNLPFKRQRTEVPDCMIHCTDDNTKLISPNSINSWQTLKKAAEVRDHEGVLNIEVGDDQIPNNVFYHRKCRSAFTHKRDLDLLEKRKNCSVKEDEVEVESNEHPERRSSRQGRLQR